ncbi:MAG TPA: hypothetical protein VNY83_00865 [Solirubrobacterales bacterium]|jgi:hypothetical protein|nr:hypothetical protein [Solirubrobacterales bacterium]
MSKPKLKRPAPGTILGALALIVAIAGNTGALAGTNHKITKADIAKGAVTAKALAPGAVHAKALAKGAVNAKALAGGAVGPSALAPDAVTASALAPNSVYGGALGPVTVHSASIADIDAVAENGTWTASNGEFAACAPGERLLTGGVAITNPGNREVAVIESLPLSNASSNGVIGRITSNSGGTAAAEVQAICLK